MMDRQFIFLAGHHRSGTSLLHRILRDHPDVSGFRDTGVPEDEGQHLQDVYPPAREFGGPGTYIYKPRSHMTEHHPLATDEAAGKIWEQWSRHLDTDCRLFIEKSPPNLIRTRFLQALFPQSKFVVILRHPFAVSFATQKWSKTSIKSLVEHTLRGYEIFLDDMNFLKNVHILRYEDFVAHPQSELDDICNFLGLAAFPLQHDVRSNVNDKYFAMWEKNRQSFLKRWHFPITEAMEQRANLFGYSLMNYTELRSVPWLGSHGGEAK